jgi:ABC-type multidrug transport system ATPase subunit
MYAIFIENLTKKYDDKEVLKEVNLKIDEGEFYALMGPNGSGKTTLASIIASVRRPTSGKVEVFGRKPEDAKEVIGYVPQENFSSPILTGKENLMYFAGLLARAQHLK